MNYGATSIPKVRNMRHYSHGKVARFIRGFRVRVNEKDLKRKRDFRQQDSSFRLWASRRIIAQHIAVSIVHDAVGTKDNDDENLALLHEQRASEPLTSAPSLPFTLPPIPPIPP
jgi:hypothetical protein